MTKEKISDHGYFGDIYLVTAEIGGQTGQFVIKEYKSYLGNEYTKEAFEHYKTAKEAGLKVFPTFRLGQDGKSILMTTGYSDEWICVSSNYTKSSTARDFGERSRERIENFDTLVENVFQEGLKAALKEVYIGQDSFFFLLNRVEVTKIDFVIGDLDHVSLIENSDFNTIAAENLYGAKQALLDFVENNVQFSSREEYVRLIKARWVKIMEDNHIPFIHRRD